MEVLRENRDSLVATLEAFVHDPLISWRLLNTKKYAAPKFATYIFMMDNLLTLRRALPNI